MKKAEEFIPVMNKVSETVIVSGRQYWNREFIVRLIKQAQLEAIEETVKLRAVCLSVNDLNKNICKIIYNS